MARRKWESWGRVFVIAVLCASFLSTTTNGGILSRIFRHRRVCVPPTPQPKPFLEMGATTRIADPKLVGAEIKVSFRLLPASCSSDIVAEAVRGSTVVREIWSGTVHGDTPTDFAWDGKDTAGKFVDTGDYRIRLRSSGGYPSPVEAPVSIVRLGITEIAAQDTSAGNNEYQMVYFMKGSSYAFFATPVIHEYLSKAETSQISDLDLDNGDPRPAPAVHTTTDSPALEGAAYEDDSYNYPLCYLMGVQPQLEVTFGSTATSASGVAMPVGYPVAGFEIRAETRAGTTTLSSSGVIAPGGKAIVSAPTLPNEVTRVDQSLECVWQYRATGAADWTNIPGSATIPQRYYTLIGEPLFKANASGTQYSGPWVEVADYWFQWRTKLGTPITTEAACVETHIKGFFGQNAGIATAIEGMKYDCGPLGGNGGSTWYLSADMGLSALLNNHDLGVYFNCSDNMGATTTMLSMMGVKNVRPVRLGSMDLRAIWGIGAPGYTLDLWGGGHGFSYHHIVTRDDAIHVIDSCMQLDEDGNPNATPGVPGWNNDREWSGPNGYESLSASNPVTKSLETLPGLQ